MRDIIVADCILLHVGNSLDLVVAIRVCANTKSAGPPARPRSRDCLSPEILGFKKHRLLQCLVVLLPIDSWYFQLTKCTCSKDQTFANLQYV